MNQRPMEEKTPKPMQDEASYRDPSGYIHILDGRVLRTVTEHGRENYEAVRSSGLLRDLMDKGMVVSTEELTPSQARQTGLDAAYVLEHERLPWISFPYEWTFSALKKAALLQLDLQLIALERDIALSDASAYNVQFVGTSPVFIDVLSFQRYREGEFWTGHRQFCEQYLNPLLLTARLGVHHNAWYRGSLEGIDTAELNRLLRLRHKLSWKLFSNITLQAILQQRARSTDTRSLAAVKARRLPRTSYRAILLSLREWIAALVPKDVGPTVWANYSRDNTYSNEEARKKHAFIHEFASKVKPRLAWDLGCNTGEFSETLLTGGARYVVGLDLDHGALENAFARSESSALRLQPIYQDAVNPSPGQGWRARERKSIENRDKPDAIIALAFEHHLAIARNVPLPDVVDWLTSLAPHGVIEFVQKSDPTIQRMLALREDIFTDYSEQTFAEALEKVGYVVKKLTVSGSERVLYWYERSTATAAGTP